MDSKEFERRGKTIFDELKSRISLSIIASTDTFSPKNLWVVERFFAQRKGEDHPGDLLFAWPGDDGGFREREERLFNLGVYVGEVVRHNVRNYEWNCNDPLEFQLCLPDDKSPLSPILFIEGQFTNYTPGSIVKWAENAGLKVGKSPKHREAHFKKPGQ
jgi:hypothetical protein